MTQTQSTGSDQAELDRMSVAEGGIDAVVDKDWLVRHLEDPTVRVVEVDVSRAKYEQGHIRGAVFWSVYADLHHSDYSPIERHELQALLSASGISPNSRVVFYGYAPYLGLWLTTAYGHTRVGVLNATRDQWESESRPWDAEVPRPAESSYPLGNREPAAFASVDAVKGAIARPGHTILDVRSRAEYEGERFWPSGATEGAGRTGHIPGALHLPIEALRAEDGSYKSVNELKQVIGQVGVGSGNGIITYCTVGGRAAEAWFVLSRLLGYQDVHVFLGSWAEWGTRSDTPVEHISEHAVRA